MKVQILDTDALRQIDPLVLSRVAVAEGWRQIEPFGRCSDIFGGEGLPEIIIPRTSDLGDYPKIVEGLMRVFAEKTGEDQLTLYERFRAANHDRVQFVASHIQGRGAFGLSNAVTAMGLVRDVVLVAAASVTRPRRVYSARALRGADPLISKFCLHQTDTCGFSMTLSYRPAPPTPQVISERQVVVRLLHALQAIRLSGQKATVYGQKMYTHLVRHGVSANLCEALARMINQMGPVGVHISWAPLYPTYEPNTHFGLSGLDVGVLRTIAKRYRRPSARLRDLLRI